MPTIFDLEESNLSAESKHLKLPVSVPSCCEMSQIFKIARGDFRRHSIDEMYLQKCEEY